MGVGKNTTSKSLDSTSEGGKYEEETKNGADFYPIPVHHYKLEPAFPALFCHVMLRRGQHKVTGCESVVH